MKSILKFWVTICLPLILGGFGIALGESLKYGDEVCIKNAVINKYATRDGNILVGKKESSREASFRMVADLDDLNMNKGKEIKYGNPIYFMFSTSTSTAKDPRFIGDSGEKYNVYGMKRTLLGVVPMAQKEKIYKFSIWPPAGTKKAEELAEEYGKTERVTREPIFYKEEVNIGYYNPASESPYKSFRFNIDRSTYKFGTEVFVSDDSKLMTAKAIKDTKKIVIQKVSGK